MKSVKLNLLIAVGMVLLFATAAQSQFFKTIGDTLNDYGECVIQGYDGGIIVTGYTNSFGEGGKDLFLAKFDSLGNLLWTRTLGGDSADQGYSLIEASDSSFVVTGYTNSFGAGGSDLLLAKFDASGNHLWTRTLGGEGADYGYSVKQASDGGLVVAGYTNSSGAGGDDLLLSKFDASGNHLWTKTVGDTNDQCAYSVVQTLNSGFAVAGYTFDSGEYCSDLLLAKFDSTGSHLWTKAIGGDWDEEGYSVIEASDGGLVVTGYTQSYGAGLIDLLLAKLNASGRFVWTKTAGASGSDCGYSLTEASDGELVVAGKTNSFGAGQSDLLLSRFNASGIHVWTRVVGDSSHEEGRSVIEVSDGGFVATGRTNSSGAGADDLLLTKVNDAGKMCLGEFVTPTVSSIRPPVTSVTPTVQTWSDPDTATWDPTITGPTPDTTTVCEGFAFIRGDVDGDSLVTWLDLHYLECYHGLIGRGEGPPPPCLDAGDANDVLRVDQCDWIYLMNYLWETGNPPPPPFPDPGFDPTWDTMDCACAYVEPTPSTIDSLIVPSASGPAGEVVSVPIIVRNSDTLLRYQIFLGCDSTILQPIGIDTTGTATGDAGPWEVDSFIPTLGSIVIWCTFDCAQQEGLSAGRDTLIKIMFSVSEEPCTTTLLDLKNVTGPPFRGNLLCYSGGEVYPTLVDGNFTTPSLAISINTSSWLTLQWTVPSGTSISDYDIRCGVVPVGADTQAWWDSAEVCAGESFFQFQVGEKDSFWVAQETSCHPECYFAIEPLDDSARCSGISNIVRFMCGDANADTIVNSADVTYLTDYLFKSGPPPKPMAAGDVDCDSIINSSDVTYLNDYLFKGGPEPCNPP